MSKPEYQAARKNMIDCQLMTNGIHDEKILDVFSSIPRELFLPDDKKHLAYVDEDVFVNDTCFIMEPVIFARMVGLAKIQSDDSVLNIGDMTGYSSDVLSQFAQTLVTINQGGVLTQAVQDVWAASEHCNIACFEGVYAEGMSKHAPYDVIFVNGAMCDVPESLLQQLDFDGRLITVIKAGPLDMGRIVVIQRQGDDSYARAEYNDAATPFITCFSPKDEFVF